MAALWQCKFSCLVATRSCFRQCSNIHKCSYNNSVLSTYLLSICLSPDLSVYLQIYLSIYPSIYLSIHRSIHPSIHPSIYLPTDRPTYLCISVIYMSLSTSSLPNFSTAKISPAISGEKFIWKEHSCQNKHWLEKQIFLNRNIETL